VSSAAARALGSSDDLAPPGVALVTSQPVDDSTWNAQAQELVETNEEWFLQVRRVCGASS
jgi:hypothetical protein